MFRVLINKEDLKKSIITTDIKYLKTPDFLCVIGSGLYGTDDHDSDVDIRGFSFVPKELLLGVKRFEQHQNITGDNDIVVWSVEKFVKMLLNGSSVAFEMLFCPENKTIVRSKPASILLRNTNVFISRKVITSMLGYAQSEWRKVTAEVTRDLGAKRKQHVTEKGYSYKNAYHAIRILDQGCSLAKYSLMKFPADGHEFLKAVKNGHVAFEDVESIYAKRLKDLEELLNTKFTEKKQDLNYINNLLCELQFKNLVRNEFAYD